MQIKPEMFELLRTEWVELIDECIFSEKERAIFKRRWLDHIGVENLAEEADMSVRQINNILTACKRQIVLALTRKNTRYLINLYRLLPEDMQEKVIELIIE
jgi:hypothetical protein